MRELRTHDVILYLALVAVYMVSNYTWDKVFDWVAQNACFMFHLFIDYFIKGYIEPLDVKDRVGQKGTLYQHILTRALKQHFSSGSSISKDDPGYSFVADEVWKRWFDLRSYLQCHNGVDLTHFESENRGLWLLKNFRTRQDHDLVVFYVPNLALVGSQPNVYTEYLATFHGLLLLQGFDNPAVFISKFPENTENWTAQEYAVYLKETWLQVTAAHPDAKFVLAGDSLGATLALSVLPELEDKPWAAILISPIPVGQLQDLPAVSLDFLTASAVKSFAGLVPDVEVDKDWTDAMPEGGIVITWGDAEIFAKETEQLASELSHYGRVKKWKRKDAPHCWPFVSFLTEDSQSEKEDSCFVLAGTVSRIVLWHTDTYLDPARSREPLNVLTIDSKHI